MAPRLRLVLVWHMHQPSYLDPETGRLALPWVRLHAARGYTDMARLAREFPGLRQTFNFTPSLVEQLEGLAAGTLGDDVQEMSRKAAEDLTPAEREIVVRHFFSVGYEHNVRPLARYAALLERRGADLARVDLARAARAFSPADLRDLVVFFHLAWCGHAARDEDPGLGALWRKGGAYSEDEKRYVVEAVDRLTAGVLGAYRALRETGAIEVSTTPYYHPILPLLVDSDVAARSLPGRSLPPRFSAPEDAGEQVLRARAQCERVFGAPPRGMWPAEGSIAPEVVPLFEEASVEWIASDEAVLLRSLPAGTAREAAIFRPWRLPGGAGRLAGFFRDHGLSDLVGFTYQKMGAEAAARDFVGRLEGIARAAQRGEVPVVAVILDGENAWEHYPHSGRDHLRAIFRAIAQSGFIETATPSDVLSDAPPREALARLHTGSWIDANFRIWIGSVVKNRAWKLLGEARRHWESRTSHPGAAAAREHLLAAEGSDWFWWFGDDFSSDQKPDFDRLFRARLGAVYRALGDPVSDGLREPLGETGPVPPTRLPTALISPELGSRNVLEWLGAGRYEISAGRQAMFGGETRFQTLDFGFDLGHLYVRLVPRRAKWREALAGGEIRVLVRGRARAATLRIPVDGPQGAALATEPAAAADAGGQAVHLGNTVECRLPFARLGAEPGEEIGIAVEVGAGEDEERYPPHSFLAVRVPTERFESENWSA